MPVEIIGEFGTPGANSGWLEAGGQPAGDQACSQMPCTVRHNMGNRTPCHRAAIAAKPAMPKAIYGIDSPLVLCSIGTLPNENLALLRASRFRL